MIVIYVVVSGIQSQRLLQPQFAPNAVAYASIPAAVPQAYAQPSGSVVADVSMPMPYYAATYRHGEYRPAPRGVHAGRFTWEYVLYRVTDSRHRCQTDACAEKAAQSATFTMITDWCMGFINCTVQ